MAGGKHGEWCDVHFHSPASPIGPNVGEQLKVSSSVFVHIVDDDKAVRESLGDLLRSMNYQVTLYGSASEFLKVIDIRLPVILLIRRYFRSQRRARNPSFMRVAELHVSSKILTT
jgi:hypothetical protein